MNVEPAFVTVIMASVVALQAWTLRELVDMKIQMAKLNEHCRFCSPHHDPTPRT